MKTHTPVLSLFLRCQDIISNSNDKRQFPVQRPTPNTTYRKLVALQFFLSEQLSSNAELDDISPAAGLKSRSA